ncbi:cytidylyltransferase domain-containing protein [Mucilaginibacter pocheonensis]|uniref:N-acylneuraminate cytidylyltransferase n=1 Tax=Mucilaginibacter pocheonensis TaxID=398050 RepID=A0ABU1T5H1_9SPHI|nr:HAD hydrolase family protein [Mucilaginibacter pocheonensis]MDR6940543.1 N-acylneuraminate cytidylyltransferase [Mucilaginibacter pocheonensis]
MKSIAIIPLRKGSIGIPGKNKKKLLGRPLYQWVLGEAIESNLDEIYIFTDDESIIERIQLDYKWTDKVKVFERSPESATNTASTEFGMLELAQSLDFDFDIYCLLQATSPLTSKDDINKTLDKVVNGGCDSALTVVESKRFLWTKEGTSINYNYLARPRRQDFEGLLIENGAVYAIKKDAYKEQHNRLGGKIGVVEMVEESLIEIDEPADWHIVEQLLANRLSLHKQAASKIKALVLDVDGVFTEGKVWVSGDGELAKAFSLRDGMGLEIARESGIEIVVMTSENSPIVDQRMRKLQINHYYKGVKDKFSLLNKVCAKLNVDRHELAYIGDDVNDLANILSVGWGFTPVDAVSELKQMADVVLHSYGGDKAIREGIETIIKLNKRSKK